MIVVKVVPFKGNLVNGGKEKKKRCHWCGTRGFGDLISCLSCEKEFFCINCIEKGIFGYVFFVTYLLLRKLCPYC